MHKLAPAFLYAIFLCLVACGDSGKSGQPVAQCAAGEPAAANFAILVDLSGTWHNEESRSFNESLLQTIGAALVKATEEVATCPTAVRYHVIGSDSLYRRPVCYATYVPTMMARGSSDPSLITRPRQFQEYLTETCPLLLNAEPEKQTQVTATLVTSLNSMAGLQSSARRIVVFSDLKEEPVQQYDLSSVDFAGVDVVLLYRALPEDQRDPTLLEQRVAAWTLQLEARGAHVVAAPDTGLGSSVGDLAKLLGAGIAARQ